MSNRSPHPYYFLAIELCRKRTSNRFQYDPTGVPIPSQDPLSYKVVVATAHIRMAHPNVNWNNYDEVKAALNLQD